MLHLWKGWQVWEQSSAPAGKLAAPGAGGEDVCTLDPCVAGAMLLLCVRPPPGGKQPQIGGAPCCLSGVLMAVSRGAVQCNSGAAAGEGKGKRERGKGRKEEFFFTPWKNLKPLTALTRSSLRVSTLDRGRD